MSDTTVDPAVQKIRDRIADPATTEKQLGLLEKKLQVLRGNK